MFKFRTVHEQLREERKRNEKLNAELRQTKADTEYIAMMCDVELDATAEEMEVNENESEV